MKIPSHIINTSLYLVVVAFIYLNFLHPGIELVAPIRKSHTIPPKQMCNITILGIDSDNNDCIRSITTIEENPSTCIRVGNFIGKFKFLKHENESDCIDEVIECYQSVKGKCFVKWGDPWLNSTRN